MNDDIDDLLQQVLNGSRTARGALVRRLDSHASARALIAAAVIDGAPPTALSRAQRGAVTVEDRQLVAIATALLDGDDELFAALLEDHLADHPASAFARWMLAERGARS
jgi:hypothetical protein